MSLGSLGQFAALGPFCSMVGLCEVCQEVEFRYTCPRCLKKTCSLQCSKDHKAKEGCSGVAHDPTSYISSEQLKNEDDEEHESNLLVQRDYNFLTQIKRTVELHKRDGKAKNKRSLNISYTDSKRPRVEESQSRRVIRRGVNCLTLPRGMQRSLANKSKWDKPLDLFVWSIEWVLFSSKDGIEPFVHVSHRIKETDSIVESMGKIIYDECCEFYQLHSSDEERPQTKEDRTEGLVKSGLCFYTKWFPYNTLEALDSRKLVRLDPSNKSIAELFRNRTVIEFPTIFVANQESSIPSQYTVIEEPDSSWSKTPTEGDADGVSAEAPVEESSKVMVPAQTMGSESDSDGYDPGVTMDFLAD